MKKEELDKALASAPPELPAILPNAAALYAAQVASLADALEAVALLPRLYAAAPAPGQQKAPKLLA